MCGCDQDKNQGVSLIESTADFCTTLQYWTTGHTLNEGLFEYVDANNDGEIQGREIAKAIEVTEMV